jgi:hypothetical protein
VEAGDDAEGELAAEGDPDELAGGDALAPAFGQGVAEGAGAVGPVRPRAVDRDLGDPRGRGGVGGVVGVALVHPRRVHPSERTEQMCRGVIASGVGGVQPCHGEPCPAR